MREFKRIIGIPGLRNLGVVRDGAIYRSAQPDFYEALPQYLGIKSVLCLNGWQQEAVEAAGLVYIPFRITVLSKIIPNDFDLLVEAMANPDHHPILVHCLQGRDRTGVACAAYRMVVDGWTAEDAWEEGQEYGLHAAFFWLKDCLKANRGG